MTKINEFERDDWELKVKHVESRWSYHDQNRISSLSRVTNYVFVLNTGGLLGALTYVASKDTTEGIQLSIVLFSWGIALIVGHAALDYYAINSAYAKVNKCIEKLYDLKYCWDDFQSEVHEAEDTNDTLLHIIGWSSALCFFAGLIVGITQVH
ncbi:MAG TPA: hypothetical protein VK938_07790 [Methylophilaceae bacterium]|nr:hypothetical protein [Methylophilaceae bacterium]